MNHLQFCNMTHIGQIWMQGLSVSHNLVSHVRLPVDGYFFNRPEIRRKVKHTINAGDEEKITTFQ